MKGRTVLENALDYTTAIGMGRQRVHLHQRGMVEYIDEIQKKKSSSYLANKRVNDKLQ